MAVWLFRAGKRGEYEKKFIQENRVYVTWQLLSTRLDTLADSHELAETMTELYADDEKPATIRNWAGQVWPFAAEMKKNDLIVMPSKKQRTICIGKITGDYRFEKSGPAPFFHWRRVEWIAESVPKSSFDLDLQRCFRSRGTICPIKAAKAEERLLAMVTKDTAEGYAAELKRRVEELTHGEKTWKQLEADWRKKHPGGPQGPPQRLSANATVFARDREIVAIAILRAAYRCEVPTCEWPGFPQEPDGEPFVEVHHIEPLAKGGWDTPDNVAALCPGHHREAHYGRNREHLKSVLLEVRKRKMPRLTAKSLGIPK